MHWTARIRRRRRRRGCESGIDRKVKDTSARSRRTPARTGAVPGSPLRPLPSAVSVAAITDAEYIDPVSMVVEKNAPVADTQTELGRVNAVESLYIAGAEKTTRLIKRGPGSS